MNRFTNAITTQLIQLLVNTIKNHLVVLLCFISLQLSAQKLTRDQYIQKYKDLAIKEMNRSGIPASITMAQAMLESDNGNSTLAQKSNNHFGIKCAGEWQGEKVYHDDDRRQECFRKYNNVYESYVDHTDFLRYKQRYAFLFELEPTDYKEWAKGLRKAGYATNPKYPELLITIIEDNKLYLLDKNAEWTPSNKPAQRANNPVKRPADDGFSIVSEKHPVKQHNRVDFVVVRDGDTYQSLTEELQLLSWELAKYNDMEKGAKLIPGERIYLQPKRRRAARENKQHRVEEGETIRGISQQYAIRIKSLCRKNKLNPADKLEPGSTLRLR